MKTIVTLLFWLIVSAGFAQQPQLPASRLMGIWQSAQKDLHVELMEEDGQIMGRIVWFACTPHRQMADYRDDANPNSTLRSRPWLGLKTLDNLTYAGNNEWRGGQIYDPNTGHTYDAIVTLTSPDRLTVRGYWKLPWLGKNLAFVRLSTSNAVASVKQ